MCQWDVNKVLTLESLVSLVLGNVPIPSDITCSEVQSVVLLTLGLTCTVERALAACRFWDA